MLCKYGVYGLSLPLLFTGGAHSRADVEQMAITVTRATLELERNGFPLTIKEWS